MCLVKILIVDTYYPEFLKGFLRARPGLAQNSYSEQHAALMAARFAESDSYSFYLGKLGHAATETIANADFVQRQWAREHGCSATSARAILFDQVRAERPDVLYMQNVSLLDDAQLTALREYAGLIVGQIASPLPPNRDFSGFDLILSSFPHFVRFFQNMGLPSEYLRLCFDPRILETAAVRDSTPQIPVSFVGGLSHVHHEGTTLLEKLVKSLPLSIWGYGIENVPKDSPLHAAHRGPAWALEMYRILASSKVALNRHIDVSGPFANNLRLYEATGVGTCLVTDARENLGELFAPDREVVSFQNAEECVEKCQYLLNHEGERAAIARAGQERTLAEHTYGHRMAELAEILDRHLRHPEQGTRRITRPTSVKSHTARLQGSIREVARTLPGQKYLRAIYHLLPRPATAEPQISYGHRRIGLGDVTQSLAHGWQNPDIAPQQRQLVNSQLRDMYGGNPTRVFEVAAEAVLATGMADGTLIEVGCASGYYYEVLTHLLRHSIHYVGIDYSEALIRTARECYDQTRFIVADATGLPIEDNSCDVLLSGCVLLHVPNYTEAIAESARATRQWCIFHRTPVVRGGNTAYLSKFAYGSEVVELVFGEEELRELFARCGLGLEQAIPINSYSMNGMDTEVDMITYVCRKIAQ